MVGAAVSGIGAIAGLGSSIIGASSQVSAADQAAATQMQMFNKTQQNLAPFIGAGQQGINTLTGAIPGLTQKFNPTIQQLEQTPGYQFVLNQGLKGVQNSYAAQGLGTSGPALMGAANYAEGLAGTTFQQQFENYWGQNQNIYNMLMGPAQLGEAAGAQQAGVSAQVGQNIGNAQIGAGNAIAGAAVGGANAIAGGANSYLQYNLMNQLLAQQGGLGGGGGYDTTDYSLFGGGR